MHKKKMIIIVTVIIAVFVGGIGIGTAVLSSGIGISTGYCLKSDNGTLFLVSGNTPIRLSGFEGGEKAENLNTGDSLLVIHSGIAESYPASTGVKFLLKTQKGDINNIHSEVIASLRQLGWLSDETVQEKSCEFTADYIRTGTPLGADIEFPQVEVINSFEELTDYERLNGETLSLGEDFKNGVKKYDEDFFSESSLVLLYLSEGSGSISHHITDVRKTDSSVKIMLQREVPEAGTCDMAYHHIFISLAKSDIKDKDIRIIIDGKDMSKNWETVVMSYENANLSVLLPEHWKYEKIDVYGENRRFGVSIYHEDSPESTLVFEFSQAFGVCGTDLTVSDITVAGYKAVKGVYGNNPSWNYIHFSDAPGEYVIYNNTDASWWSEHKDEVNEILETVKIAEGIMFREEALQKALKNTSGEYERKYGEFDCEKGVWEFSFVTGNGENKTTEIYTVEQ